MKRDLKAEIAERAEELFRILVEPNQIREKGGKLVVRCIFHEDRTASLKWDVREKFYKCFGCTAGGDIFKMIADVENLDNRKDFREILKRAAERLQIRIDEPARNGNGRSAEKPNEKAMKPVETLGPVPTKEAFAARYGLTLSDFETAGFTFVYRGYAKWGSLPSVCYPVRLGSKTHKKYKSLQRIMPQDKRAVTAEMGEGGLIGDLSKCAGRNLVLAGGEEKMLACIKAGIHAVCPQCGEGEPPSEAVCAMIAAANPACVIVAYDADDAGRSGAVSVAVALLDAKVRRVSVVQWHPETPKGRDLNDVLRDADTDAVLEIIKNAVPFGERIENPLPPFPVDKLPIWLANYARQLAETYQVSVDMPAIVCLGMVSAALGSKMLILARSNWAETSNIYAICSLPSGDRKSRVVKAALAPLLEYQREIRAADKKSKAEVRAFRKLKETEHRRVAKEAAGGDLTARDELVKLAVELEELKEESSRPDSQIIFDDCTPEALAKGMADNCGIAAIISPEAGIISNFAGRYSGGMANLDLLLKAHGGEYCAINRVKNPVPIIIERAILTLVLSPQPSLLAEMGRDDFHGRGLLARFFYSIPKSFIGSRDTWPEDGDREIQSVYERQMLSICRSQALEDAKPWVIRLENDAQEAIRAFSGRLEPRLAPCGDMDRIVDWGAKCAGLSLKLAGLIHAGQNAFDSQWQYRLITGEIMGNAIEIVETWAIPNALAAYKLMRIKGDMPLDPNVERVWQWLQGQGSETIKKSLVFRALSKTVKNSDGLNKILKILEEEGKITNETERQEGGGKAIEVVRIIDIAT